uniref:Uncharacterized protein n=1 Tax=Coccidioides posadasii RMSCC 3488 TaxID=454284 RepID=A0A0J6FPJ0_COCPO|nr:hypothetical protein CPAG_07672 [Coccidioides posadasii RMSCC 3488]
MFFSNSSPTVPIRTPQWAHHKTCGFISKRMHAYKVSDESYNPTGRGNAPFSRLVHTATADQMALHSPPNPAGGRWSGMSSPTDARAPIERLPVELIHKIFFLSLEFNFPRASAHIAAALSNEVIYTWLIRVAFSSANPSSSSGVLVHPFLPAHYFSLDANQKTELQTEILRCQWCTASLMRKCQREYVEHIIRQKCSDLIISPQDRARLDNLDPYWETMDRYSNATHGKRGKGDLIVSARHPDTGEHLKVAIWFNFGSVQIRERSPVFHETDLFRLPCCSTTHPCRMPDHLLRSPWTEEKLELLSLLSNEAYIDEDAMMTTMITMTMITGHFVSIWWIP